MQRNILKGKIVEKYGSQAQFAKVLGTSAAAISGKLTGKRGITYEDVGIWSRALDLSNEQIGSIFFD